MSVDAFGFVTVIYRKEMWKIPLSLSTGKPVWGESGELVCTKPIPCQPTHFWNDENGSKYRKAYFSKFPGV